MFRTQNSPPTVSRAEPLESPDRPRAAEDSGPLHRFLELSATLVFPLLFLAALLLSFGRLAEEGSLWLAAAGALLGLVCGDFVSGLVHWAADTYGEERTPVIGRSLVKPFRIHHVRPSEICEHDIVETIGNTCILAAPLLALALFVTVYGEPSLLVSFAVFTAVITVGVTVATNQFHKWAHQDERPRLVNALQSARIILHPEHHRQHHTAPFETSYSITNGWLNPLLNRTGFFRRLEAALRALGISPSRGA